MPARKKTLQNYLILTLTLLRKDILAEGLGTTTSLVGELETTLGVTMGSACAVGGKELPPPPWVVPLTCERWPLVGVGGKHRGVGITEAFLNLAAVSSWGTLDVTIFIIFDNLLLAVVLPALIEVEAAAAGEVEAGNFGGCSSTILSLTGLVKFSGGREYWMISGAGTGLPKFTLEYLWLPMDFRSKLFWLTPASGLGLIEVRDRRWGRLAKYWPPAPETTDPEELFKLDCRLDGLNSLLFRKDFRLKSFNMVNHDVLKRYLYICQ